MLNQPIARQGVKASLVIGLVSACLLLSHSKVDGGEDRAPAKGTSRKLNSEKPTRAPPSGAGPCPPLGSGSVSPPRERVRGLQRDPPRERVRGLQPRRTQLNSERLFPFAAAGQSVASSLLTSHKSTCLAHWEPRQKSTRYFFWSDGNPKKGGASGGEGRRVELVLSKKGKGH